MKEARNNIILNMFSKGDFTIKEIAEEVGYKESSVSKFLSKHLTENTIKEEYDRITKAKILEDRAIEEAEKCHTLTGNALAIQIQKAKNYAFLCATYCA